MYEVHQHINPETQTTTTTRVVKRSGQVSVRQTLTRPAGPTPDPKQRTDDDDDDDDDDSNPV